MPDGQHGQAAANQGGQAASGQAAGAQQSAQQQSGQQGGQGGSQQPGGQQQAGQQQGQQASQTADGQQQGQQQGGQQQGGQQAAQQGGQQQPGGQQQAAPVKYELRLPEQSPLDQADVDAVLTIAKTKNWSNEQAQAALTDMHQTLVDQNRTFRSELDADREVGGVNLEASQVNVTRVLDRFLPASEADGQRLREAINKSGYGNYLPLVKLLARIGKAMGEDQTHHGGQAMFQQGKRSAADILFGDAQGVQKPS